MYLGGKISKIDGMLGEDLANTIILLRQLRLINKRNIMKKEILNWSIVSIGGILLGALMFVCI